MLTQSLFIRFLTMGLLEGYPIVLQLFLDASMWSIFLSVLTLFYGSKSLAATSLTNARILLESRHLGGDIGDKKGNRGFGQIDGGYRKYSESLNTAFSFSGRYTDANEFMLSVPEAYAYLPWARAQLQLGRFMLPWSPIDHYWSLGSVNNRKNFTFFDPGVEGLTGIGLTSKNDFGFKLHSFASFIYIPELNPSSSVKDGQVTSKNIWATIPPKYANINNVQTPIKYYLNEPDIVDIILRPSAGQMLGFERGSFDLTAYYLYKPENSVRAAGDARLTTNGEIIANINAKLYYHEIYGSNLSVKLGENFKAYASFTRIDPKNVPANDQLFVQYVKIESILETRDYSGAGFSYKGDEVEWGVNWIALLSSPKANNDDLLGNKSRFREAINFFHRYKLADRLTNHFDLKVDLMKGDKLFLEELILNLNKTFSLGVGFHLIDAPSSNSFWTRFRDNDAVFTNMALNF